MNEITERRGLVGLPNGEVAAVQLIPWGDGQQGVMFTYETGARSPCRSNASRARQASIPLPR